jgi:FlaA1/EpsC-like NDP-sugar epimerase
VTALISNLTKFRKLFIVSTHVLVFAVSLWLGFTLRFDFAIPDAYTTLLWRTLPIFVAVKLVAFLLFNQYSGWWRFVNLHDLLGIGRAAAVSALCLAGVILIADLREFPRSVFILDALLTVGLLSTIRVGIRLFRERVVGRSQNQSAKRTLVAGSGVTAESLIREANRSYSLNLRIVGVITDDETMVGTRIGQTPILGSLADLERLVAEFEVEQVISAFDSNKGEWVRTVVAGASSADVPHRVLPPANALLDGSVSISKIRDVSLQDLLGRPPVRLDSTEIANLINGETILVTGAGGSIGSEICRQIAKFGPGRLVLLEQAENPLFLLERELLQHPDVLLEPVIADIFDAERINQLMQLYQPKIVLHAAAHKHVPLMEQNPTEAIKNNIIGTLNLVRAAQASGVDRFVSISTDKAVNPTSVMGATKRVAEMVLQGLAPTSGTKLCAVRFGNVLGSNGSVIPIFKSQIAAGGPVTVTHPDMERYFMTIPEATQLVLQAATFAETGDIFVLDMGESVKIVDVARDLIRLSGLEPDQDIEVVFSGIRPGEKLFEELATDRESTDTTTHKRIFRSKIEPPKAENVLWAADRLIEVARSGKAPAQVRKALFDVLEVLEKQGSIDQIDSATHNVVRIEDAAEKRDA